MHDEYSTGRAVLRLSRLVNLPISVAAMLTTSVPPSGKKLSPVFAGPSARCRLRVREAGEGVNDRAADH